MTFCGELRLDGRPATTALVEAMLAACPVPATGEARAQSLGPLALACRPGPALGPTADLATAGSGPAGMLAVADGWCPGTLGSHADQPGTGRTVSTRLLGEWRRYGPTSLDRLLGDWVAAVFDQASGRLVLARAVRSMRRIVVHASAERVVFATDLASLRAAGIPLRVDEAVLAELLTREVTSEHETALRGVTRVPAGFQVEYTAGRGAAAAPARRAFTSLLDLVPPLGPSSRDDAAAALRGALDAAVGDAALCSDDPDGAAAVGLSGGLDSSTVAGVAQRLAERGTPLRVVPISMVFPGQPHDESKWIDLVEAHLRTPVLRVKPEPFDWDRWRAFTARTLDLPPRPNLALADAVREAARGEGLSVLLSGEGGDDWWTGWRGHWPDLLRSGHLLTLWRQSGRGVSPASLRARARTLRRDAAPVPFTLERDRVLPPWLRQEKVLRLDLEGRAADALAVDAARYRSSDHRFRWLPAWMREAQTVLDSARSFYATGGIDFRHPFHDRRAIEVALRTPGTTLYQPGRPKAVLRAAAADALPAPVRTRRDKVSFDGPFLEAVESGGGLGALLRGGPLVEGGWVDLDAATRAWTVGAAAAREGRPAPDLAHSMSSLWQLVSLDTWLAAGSIGL